MAASVFTILAHGLDSCPKLPVEFVVGDESRADRLCKSLAIMFPHLRFTCEVWAKDRLEEPPAFTAMCGDARNGVYGDEAIDVCDAATRQYQFMGGHQTGRQRKPERPNKNGHNPGRLVSGRAERAIAEAIAALPPHSTQEDVAKKADYDEKTVRRSKAWGQRMTIWAPGPASGPSNDELLDVKSFIEAKKDLLHPKTRGKLERILADSDLHDRLVGCLVDVAREIEEREPSEEGHPLHRMPPDLAKETICGAVDIATKKPAIPLTPDKCPA